MFGKKVFKGFLVEPDGRLLKEFVFNPKGEISYEEVKRATAGKGPGGVGSTRSPRAGKRIPGHRRQWRAAPRATGRED